jgi:hypothetical protein
LKVNSHRKKRTSPFIKIIILIIITTTITAITITTVTRIIINFIILINISCSFVVKGARTKVNFATKNLQAEAISKLFITYFSSDFLNVTGDYLPSQKTG